MKYNKIHYFCYMDNLGSVFIIANESLLSYDTLYNKLTQEGFDVFVNLGYSLEYQIYEFISSDYIYYDTSARENPNFKLFEMMHKSFNKQCLNNKEYHLPISFEYIRDKVLTYFNISFDSFNESMGERNRVFVEKRQIIMYLSMLFSYPKISYDDIGKKFAYIGFSGFDRCTINHAIKTVSNNIQTNKDFRKIIDEITELI